MTTYEKYTLSIIWILYFGNKYYLRTYLQFWMFRNHFNDVLAGMLLSLAVCVLSRVWLGKELPTGWILYIVLCAGVYWEFVAPMYLSYSISDKWDIVAYITGGMLYLAGKKKVTGGKKHMYCSECGKEVDEKMRFCKYCGAKIHHDEKEQPTKIESVQPPIVQESAVENKTVTEPVKEVSAKTKSSEEETPWPKAVRKKFNSKETCRIAFSACIIIAMIAFVFPFCSITLNGEELINITGYRILNEYPQVVYLLQTLGIEAESLPIEIPLFTMVLIFIAALDSRKNLINTIQAMIAFLLLFCWSRVEIWGQLTDAGCEISFEMGYWIALISLAAAMTAIIWSKALNIGDSKLPFVRKATIALTLIMIVFTVVENKNILANLDKIDDVKDSNYLKDSIVNGTDYSQEVETDGSELSQEAGTEYTEAEIEATEDSLVVPQNPDLSFFEGTWWDINSQRCYMEISDRGNGIADISVYWSGGAFDTARWTMTGTYVEDNEEGISGFAYRDGKYDTIHYESDGSETVESGYVGGTGQFILWKDGYIYWNDERNDDGANCCFEKEE